jgi:carbon storage regulator
MLVLTRRVGEEIVVGDNIHVVVVGVQGATVRIGISAPKEVVVDRQEVSERRKQWLSEEPSFVPTPPTAELPGRLGPHPT